MAQRIQHVLLIIMLTAVLPALWAVTLQAQVPGQVDLNITTQDHYTGIELDSVAIALYFDGVLLDSTVTTADGKALLRIRVTSLESPKEMPAEFQLSANYQSLQHRYPG
jgi:hypothetical protein